MKKYFLIIVLSTFAVASNAQNDSILLSKISRLQSSLTVLEKSQCDLNKSEDEISSKVETIERKIYHIEQDISALYSLTSDNGERINHVAEETNTQVKQTNAEISNTNAIVTSNRKEVKSDLMRTIMGTILGLIIVILLTLGVYFILKKKISYSGNLIDEIKNAQLKIQEESIKLDSKLIEILEAQIKIQSTNQEVIKDVDHSFAKNIAAEIMRIEINLSRMDSSIKGYKVLSSSLRRIKDNFLANGYEIVDMLGKPYNEGMKVIANFVPDDDLKQGQQIITSISKPQINYKGVMIQAAEITVSQNI